MQTMWSHADPYSVAPNAMKQFPKKLPQKLGLTQELMIIMVRFAITNS